MTIPAPQLQVIIFAVHILLGGLCFISLFFLLTSLPSKRRRWKKVRMVHYIQEKKLETKLQKLLLISKNEEYIGIYKQLLAGCGIHMKPLRYLLIKRITMIASIFLSLLSYILMTYTLYLNNIYIIGLFFIGMLVWFLCLIDKRLLQSVRKKRSERIVREVYVLSKQLLYYNGSKMNLHSKLKRCLPYTHTIRNDMHLLTREWYEGAELAIKRFKLRLGTDEGFSFAETLNSLRLHESELYYDLLRQRVQDYKEKIELNKESKKETNSYILFILAGIPILNTFRIFVYPWVQEGQKLFESLN